MKEDTYSYKGWLLSDYVLKRAIAHVSHTVGGYIILTVPIAILGFIISLAIT